MLIIEAISRARLGATKPEEARDLALISEKGKAVPKVDLSEFTYISPIVFRI